MEWTVVGWDREDPDSFTEAVRAALARRADAYVFLPGGDKVSRRLEAACEALWSREDAVPVFSVIRFGREPEYVRAPMKGSMKWWCDLQADTPTMIVLRRHEVQLLSEADRTTADALRHLMAFGSKGAWVQGALCFQMT